MMGLQSTTELMTPLHVHGARTPEEYRALQRQFIANCRRARPTRRVAEPWLSLDSLGAYVTGGKWVVACPCGNKPSAHPDWHLACCFEPECGAIYQGVRFPEDAAAITEILLRRAPRYQSWLPSETLADLVNENARLGIPS